MRANKTPKSKDQIISKVIILCANSCPPLKPIANNRYNEINVEEFSGIFKSLFKFTAIKPKKKNNKAGFVKLSIR